LKQPYSTAVIVHWGDPSPTVKVALCYSKRNSFTNVVIVANDLRDRPKELNDDTISWLVPPRNLGFGGGCNFGAHQYPASKYAFLNSDVTFRPNAISICLDALDIPGVGISAPTLYLPDGRLQSGCGFLSRFMKIPRSNTMPIEPVNECHWVTGASLFCRHEVLESVSFDGSYFLGFEDLDIGHRARMAGWKVVVLLHASATHPARATLKGARPVYYGIRNQIWFSRKNVSVLNGLAMTLYSLRVMPRILLADLVKRRPSHARLMYYGLLAGWGPLPNTRDPLLGEPVPSRWIDWQDD
jgi:N-acetylglucosaminyl-diphospho-decaprenol L-rhamnosyltransferase